MEIYQIAIVIILSSATLIASTFGFGVGLIAIPIMALFVDIRMATALSAMAAMTVILCILVQQWRDIKFQSVWRLIIASCAMAPVGLFYLKSAQDSVAKLFLAAVIMLFAGYYLFSSRVLRLKTDRSAWLFGAMAGFLGGAYALPGPPVLIYGVFRQWPPASLRATLSGFFLPSSLIVTTSHCLGGLWTPPVLKLYGLSLPTMLLGVIIGHHLNRTIPKGKFTKAVYGLLFLSGLILLLQTLMVWS